MNNVKFMRKSMNRSPKMVVTRMGLRGLPMPELFLASTTRTSIYRNKK